MLSCPEHAATTTRWTGLSPSRRWAMVGAGAIAVLLIPWCVWLYYTLPQTVRVGHWPLLWLGLDTAEAISAAVTLLLLLRRSPTAALSAAVGAGLFFADGVFDIGTSLSSGGFTVSLLMAICLEFPIGIGALWFAARALRQRAPQAEQRHLTAVSMPTTVDATGTNG
ncbi:hypothetical protein [Nocardia terpenica]|uniref:DUF4345 domain-containing protein n=1 Tax=Nocardia terpenica TaxID=455432 RepID=A0A291RQ96_9NOCA|nr:hypothetical protein [Nocardia terpenica]ATL69791.1 hypothetical protein CRH09_30070 [Nocardia terpenica]